MQVQIILAADTIYDDEATSHFVDFLMRLLLFCHERHRQERSHAQGQECTAMAHRAHELRSDTAGKDHKQAPPEHLSAVRGIREFGMELAPRVIVALEKRVNFTLRDLAPCAPAYAFFQQCMAERSVRGWRLSSKNVDISSVPQAFAYDRGGYLVLCELAMRPVTC